MTNRVIEFRARHRDTGELEEEFTEIFTLDSLNDEHFIVEQYVGLRDKNCVRIFEGDLYRKPVTINQEMHGSFTISAIGLRNGHVVTSYQISEKGQVIPRGYTAGLLIDNLREGDLDMKAFVFRDGYQLNGIEIIGSVHGTPNLIAE